MSHLERRKHSRLELKAYGFSHLCRLRAEPGVFEVHLIDISPGGARIRLVAPKGPLPEGAVVHFDTMLSMNGLSLNGLRSSVRWVHGEECGLMFEQELDVASSDLQVLLAP